jgi:hypothetical protein
MVIEQIDTFVVAAGQAGRADAAAGRACGRCCRRYRTTVDLMQANLKQRIEGDRIAAGILGRVARPHGAEAGCAYAIFVKAARPL